tara:strand:+ start:340 stop:702 length:363 start_codon:yes stop_codon:yes gene_type:complete
LESCALRSDEYCSWTVGVELCGHTIDWSGGLIRCECNEVASTIEGFGFEEAVKICCACVRQLECGSHRNAKRSPRQRISALSVKQQAVPTESSSVSHNSADVRWVVNLFNNHETVGSSEQ